MCSLLISLYEFGQFLRIFLWITLPAAVLAMLVSTYFHYRRKERGHEGVIFAMEGYGLLDTGGNARMGGDAIEEGSMDLAGRTDLTDRTDSGSGEGHREDFDVREDPNERIYKGILWMKEKYEQYRDLADRRYEQIKEELARAEKKYQDLLEGREEKKAADMTAQTAPTGDITAPTGDITSPAADMITPTMDRHEEAGTIAEEPLVWTGSDADKEAIGEIVKEKNRQIRFLQSQLDQRIKNYHQLEYEGRDHRSRLTELETQLAAAQQTLQATQGALDAAHQTLDENQRTIEDAQRTIEDRQRTIGEMDGHLLIERNKVEDLVAKLQNNSLLLMNIYKELDKSLHLDKPAQL
ncbi:MAG TPA: hypothetical protein VGM30_09135 [Puia sp.]|jgi:chromosome segregation ATPase